MPTLPPSVTAYFASRPDDTADMLATVFTSDAFVVDEKKEHRGISAIRNWRIDTMKRTPFTARLLSVEERDGRVIVPTEVSASFPGSPVTLEHRFTLRGALIAEMEIK